ncbi:hypothetical protein AB3U99_08260 [Niallia sp. JL1B1071]|uniref:hypothetical protein n=1 Tax=Niallia tiangongensis TaxID=3237105 RepID=UPI0037DCF5E3
MKNNQEKVIKDRLEKEFNSIKVPNGMKEELWTQVSSTRKKSGIASRIFPYIAAVAFIFIVIPLGLSVLPYDSEPMPNDHENIKTIEAVIKNNFTSPDDEWEKIMNNTDTEEEGEIKGLREYEEDLYREYFASDEAFDEYVSRYGSVVWIEPERHHYKLRALDIKCEKTNSDEIIYNFSAKVEYQKEGSSSAAVGTITGQANLNEEHKIEVMKINYFDLIDQLSK